MQLALDIVYTSKHRSLQILKRHVFSCKACNDKELWKHVPGSGDVCLYPGDAGGHAAEIRTLGCYARLNTRPRLRLQVKQRARPGKKQAFNFVSTIYGSSKFQIDIYTGTFLLYKRFKRHFITCVTDPDPGSGILDPGSGAFFTWDPGSWIDFSRIPDLGCRIPNLGTRISDPVSRISHPGFGNGSQTYIFESLMTIFG